MSQMQPKDFTIGLLNDGKTIQQKFDELDSSHPSPEFFGAKGDGITDDLNALNQLFDKTGYGEVHLSPGKIYAVSGAITTKRVTSVNGAGSTIKLIGTPTVSTVLLGLGTSKGSLSSLSIPVAFGSNTITIPGIGIMVESGDLVSIGSSELRLDVNNLYYYGQRAVVIAVTSDTITLDSAFYADFTVDKISIHRGISPLSIRNLKVDITSADNTTAVQVQGVSLTGVNMLIENCKIIGSRYCAVGAAMQGCRGIVHNSLIGGFLQDNGSSSRVGYGVYLDGTSLRVEGCKFFNNKHCVTAAARAYITHDVVIINNFADTLNAPTSEAVFDFHANVIGVPLVQGNHIYAGKSVFNARCGSVRITDNYVYNHRTDTTDPALIGVYEWLTVSKLEVINNCFDTSSNVRLFFFGDITSVTDVTVSGNIGTLGAVLRQTMNLATISDFEISNNQFHGVRQLVEASRRSSSSTQTLFSKLDGLRILNNTIDASATTAGSALVHIWTNANNAVDDRLILSDFEFSGNLSTTKDTPIQLEYLTISGIFKIYNNTLRHDINSSGTAPTLNSIDIINSSVENANISGNQSSGRFRFAVTPTQIDTSIAYPSDNVYWTFNISNNSCLGLFCDQLVNAATHRCTIGNSRVSNNKFINPYGTCIGFTSNYSTMGWGSGGCVDIANNSIFPSSGSSVGIGQGYGTHKIVIRDNIISGPINDVATPFLNVRNDVITL